MKNLNDIPRFEEFRQLNKAFEKGLGIVMLSLLLFIPVPVLFPKMDDGFEASTIEVVACTLYLIALVILMSKGLFMATNSRTTEFSDAAYRYLDALEKESIDDLINAYMCREELTQEDARFIKESLDKRKPGWSKVLHS